MSKIKQEDIKLKGIRTIFHPKSEVYEHLRKKSFEVLNLNGYKQVILPTYDYENSFLSSLGEGIDITQKEMFTFQDKKKRKLALRPEGTACIKRSIFHNSNIVESNKPSKFFYWSNMFRYERPQKGRYREFWQLGVELINSSGFQSDCEIIFVAWSILKANCIEDFVFVINYLGDENTKKSYIESLKNSLKDKTEKLCADCKKRLSLNALRIIDCKLCYALDEIPNYESFLSKEDNLYFKKIENFLSDVKIEFLIDRKLVRGISYYNGLVFEAIKTNKKKSLLGGGRYDNLVSNNSIKKQKFYPSVGFALGIDRIIDFFEEEKSFIDNKNNEKRTDIAIISLNENFFSCCYQIKKEIQKKNSLLKIDVLLKKNKNFLKNIEKLKPSFSFFFGKKEKESNIFFVKNHDKQEVFSIKNDLLVNFFSESFGFQNTKSYKKQI